MQIGLVQLRHFLTYCQTYHEQQHMLRTHADDVLCLQLHTVGSWPFALFRFLIDLSSWIVHLDYVALSTIAMFFFQTYKTEIKDLEHQGELGNGTCGHVVKMRHKPSETVIAVKVTNILCLN